MRILYHNTPYKGNNTKRIAEGGNESKSRVESRRKNNGRSPFHCSTWTKPKFGSWAGSFFNAEAQRRKDAQRDIVYFMVF